MLELSDALRHLLDPAEIELTASRVLGEHIGANRALYTEIVDGQYAVIERDWVNGLPSIAGRIPLAAVDTATLATLTRGEPLIIDDAATDPRLSASSRRAFEAAGVAATLCTSLFKSGRWVAAVSVQTTTPRKWTAAELELVAETGERTWTTTERARADRRLRESERSKAELLAVLGHELRNPLAAIRSATELLAVVAPEDRRLERAHAVLQRQSSHMAALVDGLLEASRVGCGKVRLECELLELRALVEELASERVAELAADGLELRCTVGTQPAWVCGDRVRLTQVIDNLLGNAVKFTDPPGRIDVTLASEDDTVVVRVRDTGVGVRPEMLDRLFEPFAQEPEHLRRTGGGLGLGLAVAKGLVELHAGRISAASAGLGAGTTFEVRLPRSRSPAPALEHARDEPEPTGRHRVLIVEDNEDAAEMLRILLELSGHEVRVARTGDEALAELRRRPADLLLCDLGLPGMSGYEVAQAIREDPALCGTRLVALTGYGQPEHRRRCAQAGFDEHLTKPIDLEALRGLFARMRSR